MRVTHIERAPGVWRLRVERGRDPSGKRLFSYETLRGNEEAAQRRRFEILSAHEAGSFAVPDKVTMAQFFERYVADKLALGKIGRSTAENYETIFALYVAPELGGLKLQTVRGTHIQALYTKLIQRGTLKLRTVEHVHRILTPAFRTARKQKLITVNPMEEVERPKPAKSKPKAIAEAAIGGVRDALRGKWFEVPALLALTTGIRRGEVCGLRRCDVDLGAGKLSVRGQIVEYRDGTLEWKEPKTEAGVRHISLSAETVELLRVYVKTMLEHRMKLGLGGWKDTDYLFTRDGTSALHPHGLTQAVKPVLRGLGLEYASFHSTRHTHATVLLKKVGKTGAKAVSQRLGHADIQTTLGVYQTVFEEDDMELAALTGGMLGGSAKP